MMEAISHTEVQDWHNFEIGSRREIASLLRQIGEKNQLVRMLVKGEQDVCVTTLLDMDESAGTLLLDCSIDAAQNLRILAAKRVRFDTTLDKIRIVFMADDVEPATYEGRPALCCPIPATLIRLQRREYYRMETPVASPIRVTIPLLTEGGGSAEAFAVSDISVGGLAILDNKLLLKGQQGLKLAQCSIALPDGVIGTTLLVRNSTEVTLLNGKQSRRIGCQFTDLSRASLANVQRYITKLERERNAKMAGLE
ncbi:MAG: flagellar brake protein [Pseudomonadota bacterium]|nr:flagellar brake protein [Pseudomonadota bacterium]